MSGVFAQRTISKGVSAVRPADAGPRRSGVVAPAVQIGSPLGCKTLFREALTC